MLVDQRDQVRRMQAPQSLAFDDDPIVVEVLDVVAAVEGDRRSACPVVRKAFVFGRIERDRRLRVPVQRRLVGYDPRRVRRHARQRSQRTIEVTSQRSARALVVVVRPKLLRDRGARKRPIAVKEQVREQRDRLARSTEEPQLVADEQRGFAEKADSKFVPAVHHGGSRGLHRAGHFIRSRGRASRAARSDTCPRPRCRRGEGRQIPVRRRPD